MVENDWRFGGCKPSKPNSYQIKAKAWDELYILMEGTPIAEKMDIILRAKMEMME